MSKIKFKNNYGQYAFRLCVASMVFWLYIGSLLMNPDFQGQFTFILGLFIWSLLPPFILIFCKYVMIGVKMSLYEAFTINEKLPPFSWLMVLKSVFEVFFMCTTFLLLIAAYGPFLKRESHYILNPDSAEMFFHEFVLEFVLEHGFPKLLLLIGMLYVWLTVVGSLFFALIRLLVSCTFNLIFISIQKTHPKLLKFIEFKIEQYIHEYENLDK